MRDEVIAQLKHDIKKYYEQKYNEALHADEYKHGDVLVNINEFLPEGEHAARVQVTISDNRGGFITRHYGRAEYKESRLSLHTLAI